MSLVQLGYGMGTVWVRLKYGTGPQGPQMQKVLERLTGQHTVPNVFIELHLSCSPTRCCLRLRPTALYNLGNAEDTTTNIILRGHYNSWYRINK
ncbi:hypothetical protein CsSME_00036214 [Camellia sinensis var. sinensis]